jgi:beta-barrel assembly-enhancing protease
MLSRRALLRHGCTACVGFTGLLGGGLALAQTGLQANTPLPASLSVPDSAGRFARPALDTEEGGLWAMMDREETRLRRSPFLVRDEGLNQYLQNLVCKLGGPHCPDIRVHLVRTPWFNATMAPNGMMQVWTGLLLRMENEAQLAAILGHELGHYMERHSLERLRDIKGRAAFAQFLGMFGAIGQLGSLGVLAGAFAFSRDHETRADAIGMRLVQQAGYDGKQAALVWDNVLAELKIRGGDDAGKRSPMMATHPPADTRRNDLLQLAGDMPGRIAAPEFEVAIAPHRFEWLQDEIKRGQFEESLVLFSRMIKNNGSDASLHFARGEVYRQRNAPEDFQLALDDLSRAAVLVGPPALTFRSLGLIHKQRGDKLRATQSFEKYVTYAPHAGDVELIKQYLAELAS